MGGRVNGVDWAPLLATLRTELAEVFAVWLPRLSVLLGPAVANPRPEATGELDGVQGLSRRGPWDRLVMSEWALCDAVPVEFLRRATDGELLFTEPARVAPVHAPVTTVFFDDGPTQLGVPRLVHLALWMVFQERARAAGGELRCHVRSAPRRRLGSNPLDLLEHRAAVLPALPEGGAGERLVVGHSVAGETMVEVAEVGATLVVRYMGREVVLDRPPLDAAAVFLRRPAARRRTRSGPHEPYEPREREGITALVLRNDRIHVRFGSVLTIWPLTKTPRVRTKPRYQTGRWRASTRRLVAVGTFVRQLVLVEEEGEELVFSGVFGTHRVPLPVDLVVPGEDVVLPAVGMPRVYLRDLGVERAGVVFRDDAGAVWAATAQPPVVRRIGTAVVGPIRNEQLSWLTPEGQRVTSTYGGEERLAAEPSRSLRTSAVLSAGVDAGLRAPEGGAALIRGNEVWLGRTLGYGRLGERSGTWRSMPPGRLVAASWSGVPALLCIEDGRAVLHTKDGSRPLDFALADEVAYGALSADTVVVADTEDRVHIYDRESGGHRVSFGWEDIQ